VDPTPQKRKRPGHDTRAALNAAALSQYSQSGHDTSRRRCAISAIVWSRAAIVHRTGGQVSHYTEAISAAEIKGRCLFIETDSVHAPAWAVAIQSREVPYLNLPPKGGVHPVDDALKAGRSIR
jgi:hypothetical protein